MSEHEAVLAAEIPRTRASLGADLRRLGVGPGMTLLVHSSLRSLGWVAGGPVAVIQALMDVLTPGGTLVMPAHTGENSEPSRWQQPPVPEHWWPIIRESMPGYDPAISPTRGMGRIAELFRTFPGVRRSSHPEVSFAAWGRHADLVTAHHGLAYGLGESSPLARIYDLDGHLLLLGVGHDSNTSFHLAEYRIPNPTPVENGAALLTETGRAWVRYPDIVIDADPFEALGADFERETGRVLVGRVGSATARLFAQRPAVDYAVGWLGARRQANPQ